MKHCLSCLIYYFSNNCMFVVIWLKINFYFFYFILASHRHGTYRFLQNQNSVPAKAPPITVKDAITPTMTKTLPLEVLSFLASWRPSLLVDVLFRSSVGDIRCSDVTSVVEISVVASLDRAVVTRSVVNALVETFPEEIVVVSSLSVDSVVVRRVSLLLAVEAMVEAKVTLVVESFCFVNWVVTTLLVVLDIFWGIVTCEDIVVVRSVSMLSVVKAMVEVVVTTMREERKDVQKINSHRWLPYFHFNADRTSQRCCLRQACGQYSQYYFIQ